MTAPYHTPRLKSCVENWPDCAEGDYDPACCRFPKSCSCTVYSEEHVTEADLVRCTCLRCAPAPAAPPSSAFQGSVRTEGPDEGLEPQTGTQPRCRWCGVTCANPACAMDGYDIDLTDPAYADILAKPEPPLANLLRALAWTQLADAENGTRTQKAAAKAAARAYRLAADMIEEEQA